MSSPKISVIVPLYKTERFVERCIRSIMEQTFTDIEILCVDDVSPDRSAEIVAELARSDPRIVLIRHEVNLGSGGARNTAIRAAKAEYIASVDSDDYVDPVFLESLWLGTDDGHFDIVACGFARVDEQGNILERSFTDKKKIIDPLTAKHDPFRLSNPALWNKLWRRSLYVDNDIFFPDQIFFQDSATTPRLYAKAKNIRFIGGDHYKYFNRGDGVTNSTSDKHLLDRFRESDLLKEFLVKEELLGKYGDSLVKRISRGYAYHAANVTANASMSDERLVQYLRHLLLMRDAYLQYDDLVREMSKEAVLSAFRDHVPLAHLIAAREGVGPSPWSPAGSAKEGTGRCGKGFPAPSRATGRSRGPKLRDKPRVLVLTMFSGENEFEACCRSLSSQSYGKWTHEVLRGLGDRDAHRALYEAIMSKREEFDIFLKLDADTRFARDDVLEEIVEEFRSRPTLDHLMIACDDYMSGQSIMGVDAYSNRISLTPDGQEMSRDPDGEQTGRRHVHDAPRGARFLHAADPSPFQAFHFGARRILKLGQRGSGREGASPQVTETGWRALLGVWRQANERMDRRHALALVAADLVVSGELDDRALDYSDPGLWASFERHAGLSRLQLLERVESKWRTSDARERYFAAAVIERMR